jgi:hypothetical protein
MFQLWRDRPRRKPALDVHRSVAPLARRSILKTLNLWLICPLIMRVPELFQQDWRCQDRVRRTTQIEQIPRLQRVRKALRPAPYGSRDKCPCCSPCATRRFFFPADLGRKGPLAKQSSCRSFRIGNSCHWGTGTSPGSDSCVSAGGLRFQFGNAVPSLGPDRRASLVPGRGLKNARFLSAR